MQTTDQFAPHELAIPGYKDQSLISETERFSNYRALTPDGQQVFVKTPTSNRLLLELTHQFEHELEIAAGLNPDCVVRPIKIERGADRAALILEPCPYPPLTELLQAPLEMATFLPIAIGIAAALSEVHRHGLVHKDIKPENIFARIGGDVKLTGFGIASRSPRERQPASPPECISGTLAYMAPEQTGRMNRSIDARSDLYALGVIFYQMLTGQLPFTAADPMEWVHCHIALQPTPPRERNPAIPEALSNMVMKLLAKTAEERYQTAGGLKADLEHCLEQWREQGYITPFPLGARDISNHLLITEKLYGREREMETLVTAFDRVVTSGKPELVLVSGYSGVGKSVVVNELLKARIAKRCQFTSGKFDQYKRGIPYATLAQAFDTLIRPLLGKNEDELDSWRQLIQQALEPNGRLIVDLVPELKFIIGEQPPVPSLEPQQAKARFQLALRHFIGVFARREHPLVIFIDDLQWLDAATLDLIENLVTQEDVRHLLLVGAYRENEVGPDHPLTRKLETIRRTGAPVTEIKLTPLSLTDLTQMVKDSLKCELENASQLAKLVHTKTAGSPFFAIQFLTSLAQEGLLAFDHDKGRWSWDLNLIQAKGYTDNVADLMAMKLAQLPSGAQRAVQQFACLGTAARAQTLSLILQTPEEKLDTVLQDAISQGVLQRFGDSYGFVHDRVQEAVYVQIPRRSRAENHLRIGRRLFSRTPETLREEAIFEIVGQLNHGQELIVSQKEREELARLNLSAGKRAMGSAAYSEALTYLSTGASLLTKACWERQHELAYALEINRAESEFLTGELETAERRLAELSPRVESSIERANITSLCIDLYMTLGQMDHAVAVGLDYLRHQGIDWSAHPTVDEAQREYDRIWLILGNRVIEDLIDLPIVSDPELLATMEVLIKLRPPALFTDVNLVSMVICKAVNLSLEHGNSDASCFAYASFGIVAGPRFGNYEEAYQFGKLGYELVEQRGLKRFQARTYTNFGIFVIPWVKHIRAGRDLLQRSIDVTSRSGDIIYGAYAWSNMVANLLMSGDPLIEVEHQAMSGLDFVQKARFSLVSDIITSQLGLIRTLRGLTGQFGSFGDEGFDERQFEEHFTSNPGLAVAECFHWIRKLQASYLAGDVTAAIEAAKMAEPLLWTSKPFIEAAEYSLFAALSHAACCGSPTDSHDQQHLQAVSTQLRQLKAWAKVCPENFENRAALVEAEIARIEERPLDAMQLYEKAIQSAHSNGFIHNEAIAHELAGRFYLAQGLAATGHAHLQQARTCYIAWGADGKSQQLDRLFPQLSEQQPQLTEPDVSAASQQLDVATVTKASQALSGEIELPNLIETLMASALKNAGADRCLLILPREQGYAVEVEAKIGRPGIEIRFLHASIDETMCPVTIVNKVIHTCQYVIVDDTSHPGEFTEDLYLSQGRAKSILCLPLLRQGELDGVLYLENTQAIAAFTPERVAVLDVMAAQAAISLENARLYGDLRESEAKFRTLVQKIQTAIVVHGAKTQILISNSKAQELLGLREDQMLGRTAFDSDWHFLREDGSEMPQEEYPVNRVLASRTVLQNHVVGIRHPDPQEDAWALVNAIPVFDEADEIVQVFVTFTDITERKKAEQQLVESEQLFRTLVENSPDYIARYDRELNRIYINPTLQKLFQIPLTEALDHPPVAASPMYDPKRYMDDLKRVLETRQEWSDELTFRGEDGETHWAQSRFAPEFGPNGEISSVLAISHDITLLKQAEQEHQIYLSFLENLDRINRVLQQEGDIAQVMNKVLDEVLDIFGCDRAFLIHPCDPDAATWSVVMESTRPEYPDAAQQGPQPMEDTLSSIMRILLESAHPLQMGPGSQYPIPELLQERYNTRAVMAMILRPRIDKPWQFGIQQCSHDRIWTDQETRLFEEISNRLSDSLNDLLTTRNLRDSEERFRLVFENSPVPIQEEDYSDVKAHLEALYPQYGDDLEGYLKQHPKVLEECVSLVRMTDINRAALRLHEAENKEAMLHGLSQILMPESMADFQVALLSLMRGKTSFRLESKIQTLTGRQCNIDAFFSIYPGYEQTLGKILVSLIDISELKQAEQERQTHLHFLESLDRVNRVLQTDGDIERIMNMALDEILEIFDCDRAYLLYPCDPDAATWSVPIERTTPAYPGVLQLGQDQPMNDYVASTFQRLLESDQPVREGPGTQYPVAEFLQEQFHLRSYMATAIYPMLGKPWQLGLHQCSYDRIWTDQELRLFEEIGHRLSDALSSLISTRNLRENEERLRLAASVFSNSQEGILISDADNRIIDINPAFTRLTGYSREEAIGQNPDFLRADRQNKTIYEEMWQSIATFGEWQGELWNQRKSGEVYPELLSIVAVKDEQGRLQHYVGAFSDISTLKQHEADLDRIAHYDMLTSVPNRRLLSDRLEQAISYTRRHGKNLAVCYLDLDGFKPINDQFGHDGGDRMLFEIARRLESMSRGEDTVARLGGDEFVLLWNDIDTEADCMRALERILERVAEPMLLSGEPVSVSASIGVTLYPDDDVDADSLLRHADHAMYMAKQLGKNRYQLFDAHLERQISAQAELLARVAQGLDRKQFELYYQPKVDFTDGSVVGVEALLRWNDPILGLVGPKEFLSLIENDSLAFHMGRWVMDEAVRQAKIWNDAGIMLPISINIFPRHLKYPNFIDDLQSAIESNWPRMPKHRLLLEIVETSDLEDLEPIEAVIKECLELGIGFSLDDFGTGYSSLVYLRRLSIEELKIDQSFVRDMLEDKDDKAIVIGVIRLGQAFDLRVVAEGVESVQHAQHLVDLGCSIIQGYEFGRPMPAHAFREWYAKFKATGLNTCHK